MKIPRLPSLFQSRRLIRAIERLAAAQEAQVTLLGRIADRVDPAPLDPPSPDDLKRLTEVSYTRDADMARIEAFRDDVRAKLKREPTEEEIVAFLDGKEVSLD